MASIQRLIAPLLELRALLARPGNDFSWSSWEDAADALACVDEQLAQLGAGVVPDLSLLLVPTCPAQEVSLSSGWAKEYLAVAARIEDALKQLSERA